MPEVAEPPKPVESPDQIVSSDVANEFREMFGGAAKVTSRPTASTPPAQAAPPTPPKETKPAAKPAPASDKPANEKPAPEPEKPVATPSAQQTPTPTEDGKGESDGIKNIRSAYEKTKRKLAEIETKLPELEENSSKYKVIAEQYEKTTSELNRLRDELKFADYSRSSEYKEKYVDPIHQAAKDFQEEFIGYENEGHRVTEEDLAKLIDLPTQSALQHAKTLFGDMAGEAMSHRRRILHLDKNRKEALESFKKTAADRENQFKAQQEAQRVSLIKTYRTQLESMKKEAPTIYVADDTDVEGQDLLDTSFARVDAILDSSSDIQPDARAKGFAEIRMKAGAFDRVTTLLEAERKKTAELTAELEQFRAKDPGAKSRPTTETPPSDYQSPEEELAQIFSSRR